MPNGGTVTIATSSVEIGVRTMIGHGQEIAPGRYLRIDISDTGSGMPAEVQSRLFEPFFTTKPLGHGTGLGLASAFATLREHHGGIQVRSQSGVGTTITFLLPVPTAPALPVPAVPIAPVPARGRGRILLVEDESLLRALCHEQLSELGYQVTEAADGIEALERFSAQPNGFDAVVLDSIMPRLGGQETFRALRARWPDVRVVMMSGFGVDAERMLSEGIVAFLPKPYTSGELALAVVQALAR
jgi:two-component system cell cycle sensor histidine kinase/response regulator CckA